MVILGINYNTIFAVFKIFFYETFANGTKAVGYILIKFLLHAK